ncbi:SMI1/KNR4 family protein [Glycomyces sp. NPDC047010]|uniref:SMI1/KNR4 family protein n=1 Tax=Glycomyces sp. NPDC047010 TaxID=3155023 RepID=UPI0033E996A8
MSVIARLESAIPAMVQFRAAQARGVRWGVLRGELGVELPSDFRALAEAYPALEFEDFLRVELPEPGKESSFVTTHRQMAEILDDWRQEGYAAGYIPFPEPGGLLLWGLSNQGDSFFWRTWSESPDNWSVVVSGRNGDWSEYAIGVVDFLAALYRKDFTIPGMPRNWPGDDPDVVAV